MGRPKNSKNFTPPKGMCTVCSQRVSPRRSTTLTYPTMILCSPCYEINIDNLFRLSEQFDTYPLIQRKAKPKKHYQAIVSAVTSERVYNFCVYGDVEAVNYIKGKIKAGEQIKKIVDTKANEVVFSPNSIGRYFHR